MEKEPACTDKNETLRTPWNKGKLIGAKPPLRPSHVWSIRTKLQMRDKKRDLALFNQPSTANCEAVMWSRFASMTWRRAVTRKVLS